jgi:hypothetical protein
VLVPLKLLNPEIPIGQGFVVAVGALVGRAEANLLTRIVLRYVRQLANTISTVPSAFFSEKNFPTTARRHRICRRDSPHPDHLLIVISGSRDFSVLITFSAGEDFPSETYH